MRRLFIACIGFLAALSFTTVASAQTIYEPVQYQYGNGSAAAPTYYYGGSSSVVFRYGDTLACRNRYVSIPSRSHRNTLVHRRLLTRPVVVFSDCVPWMNASVYGFSIDDARNQASLNVPRYFRKANLDAAGTVNPDGTRVVGPQTQPVEGGMRVIGTSAKKPAQPIIIIPKHRLRDGASDNGMRVVAR